MSDIEVAPKKISPFLISIFCIGIILFILFTQCEVSNIKLKPKDASLILIFLALLAYINNNTKLFLFLLGSFLFIYFTPNNFVLNFLSKIIPEKKPKSIIKKKVVIEDPNPENDYEDTESMGGTEVTDITLDTDIELDDIAEPENIEEDPYLTAKKRIN